MKENMETDNWNTVTKKQKRSDPIPYATIIRIKSAEYSLNPTPTRSFFEPLNKVLIEQAPK